MKFFDIIGQWANRYFSQPDAIYLMVVLVVATVLLSSGLPMRSTAPTWYGYGVSFGPLALPKLGDLWARADHAVVKWSKTEGPPARVLLSLRRVG